MNCFIVNIVWVCYVRSRYTQISVLIWVDRGFKAFMGGSRFYVILSLSTHLEFVTALFKSWLCF